MDYMSLGIEDKIEHLEFSKTQNYFREAYNCYINGSYRAAVVALWSVMVCDAIYKTQKLATVYEDSWAIKKLKSISELQEKNAKLSDWEMDLFEDFYKNKKFIGIAEMTNIRDIQQKRHLCAHPILSEDSNLYSPNKEYVRSMLINAMDGFLLKQSYYNKDVFKLIIETLSENSERYEKRENVKKLIGKFAKRMTQHAIFEVFKSFWKVSFLLENEDCVKYRRINYFACIYFYDEIKAKPALQQRLEDDKEYFDKISNKIPTLRFLFGFLCSQRTMLRYLSQETQEILVEISNKEHIDEDEDGTLQIATMFKFKTPHDYFADMKAKVEARQINYLSTSIITFIKNIYHDSDCNDDCLDLLITYASNARNYDEADYRLSLVIENYLKDLSIVNIEELLSACETNTQIKERRRASKDVKILSERLTEITL